MPHFWFKILKSHVKMIVKVRIRSHSLPEQAASGTGGQNVNGFLQKSVDSSFL